VIKAAVGLSASVFGVLFVALQLTVPQYLLLCLVLPSAGCLLALPFVNHVPWMQRCERMPHGLLTTPSRFLMAYQVRARHPPRGPGCCASAGGGNASLLHSAPCRWGSVCMPVARVCVCHAPAA
jgi:hypothetical protein